MLLPKQNYREFLLIHQGQQHRMDHIRVPYCACDGSVLSNTELCSRGKSQARSYCLSLQEYSQTILKNSVSLKCNDYTLVTSSHNNISCIHDYYGQLNRQTLKGKVANSLCLEENITSHYRHQSPTGYLQYYSLFDSLSMSIIQQGL